MHHTTFYGRATRTLSVAAFALSLAACNSDVLEVKDPDVVDPSDLTSAAGAQSLRSGVVARLQTATTSPTSADNIFLFGGLVADEWRSGDTFEQRNTADQRNFTVVLNGGATSTSNSFVAPQFRALMRVRNEGDAAIAATRIAQPTPKANIGLIFALKAYAAVLLGEHFCNGIPFSRAEGSTIVFGSPVSVDSAFSLAANEADSALANLDGTDTLSVKVARMATIVKARALLNRGRFTQAGTVLAATVVPSTFVYQVGASTNTADNGNWSLNTSAKRYVLSDREGTVGLNFRTAADPRIPTTASGNAFDSSTPFVATTKWARFDPTTIISGAEARLMEAEVQLQTDTVSQANRNTVTAQLNTIRATAALLPAGATLAPLVAPTTNAAMVDLLFRERAFWMFGTGHRLGDLRRLMRQYGRSEAATYPNGAWHKGGNYATYKVIPLPQDEQNNPGFTGCTNLNP